MNVWANLFSDIAVCSLTCLPLIIYTTFLVQSFSPPSQRLKSLTNNVGVDQAMPLSIKHPVE
jgi:hypothetical protein